MSAFHRFEMSGFQRFFTWLTRPYESGHLSPSDSGRLTGPVRTVGEYLRRWGYTPQKPIKRAYERNPVQVKKWLEEEYPEISRRAKAEGAGIPVGDGGRGAGEGPRPDGGDGAEGPQGGDLPGGGTGGCAGGAGLAGEVSPAAEIDQHAGAADPGNTPAGAGDPDQE